MISGTASVVGWEQAVSWDGRLVAPLLSDSCPHVLVVLLKAHHYTALTLELQKSKSQYKKVLTLNSGGYEVSIDSELMVSDFYPEYMF